MRCPYCAFLEDRVIDSRPSDDHVAIRRRRECLNCKMRFTTYENIEALPLIVVKRDRSRQVFDREKLIQSILKSCIKRPVSTTQIEQLVAAIEAQAANQLRREITSSEIGEQVLNKLELIDAVAYVRFASVYRDFDDLDSFLSVLTRLKAQATDTEGEGHEKTALS